MSNFSLKDLQVILRIGQLCQVDTHCRQRVRPAVSLRDTEISFPAMHTTSQAALQEQITHISAGTVSRRAALRRFGAGVGKIHSHCLTCI